MRSMAGLVTAETFATLPESGFELVRGELRKVSQPSFLHGAVASKLSYLLQRHVLDHGLGGVVGVTAGFWIERDPDTVRAPDVWHVSAERLRPEAAPTPWLDGAPDLAI